MKTKQLIIAETRRNSRSGNVLIKFQMPRKGAVKILRVLVDDMTQLLQALICGFKVTCLVVFCTNNVSFRVVTANPGFA